MHLSLFITFSPPNIFDKSTPVGRPIIMPKPKRVGTLPFTSIWLNGSEESKTTSAPQTFLCRGPVTSNPEAVWPLVIKFYFKKVEVYGGLHTMSPSETHIGNFYFRPG